MSMPEIMPGPDSPERERRENILADTIRQEHERLNRESRVRMDRERQERFEREVSTRREPKKSTYQKSKDECIKIWHFDPSNYRESLEAGVYCYGGTGRPKFQVGPRRYNNRVINTGRLTTDEVVWLYSIMDDVMEIMDKEEEKIEPS